jgi:hypothetical protein
MDLNCSVNIMKTYGIDMIRNNKEEFFQFQTKDGLWHNFIDEDHYLNTVEDGRWPIRKMHTSPPTQPTKATKAKLLTDQQLRDMCAKFGWDDSYQSIRAYRTVEAMSLELNQLER